MPEFHADARIDNHDPVPLRPLVDILRDVYASGKDKVFIFLDANHINGKRQEHGWLEWHTGGLFVDPFGDNYFFLHDITIETSRARLLQPKEVLHIDYHVPENHRTLKPLPEILDYLVKDGQKWAPVYVSIKLKEEKDFKNGWFVYRQPGLFTSLANDRYFSLEDVELGVSVGRLLQEGERLQAKWMKDGQL